MPGGYATTGSQYNEYQRRTRTFAVPASHASLISVGDAVLETGTADALGNAQVDVATAGSLLTGIVVGIRPDFANEAFSDSKILASTAGIVFVNVDPRAEFEVDVVNGPLLLADVGLNANLVATAATTTGGLTTSNMTLNATGKATTATLQFRILSLLAGTDGVLGSRAKVRLNAHTSIAGAAGV